MGRGESLTPVMPWGGMRIEEPGRGPWYQRKKENGGEKEVSCYATGWHENKGTRLRTVVSQEKRKMEEKGSLLLCLGGHENKETRSRTVVPKKKTDKTKERMEEERSLLLCLGGHENKGIRSRTVEFKRRKEVADFCYATGWREERVT